MKNLATTITTRYTIPNKFDIAPYASICKVIDDNGHPSYYLQTQPLPTDPQHPCCQHACWTRIGDIIEEIFEPHYLNQNFIKACLIKSLKPLY